MAWFKNNRVFAGLIIVGILIIALGNFTEAIDRLWGLFRDSNSNAAQTPTPKPISLDSFTMQRIRSGTEISLESVQPSPDQVHIVPGQFLQLSGNIYYRFPDWIDAMELSLEANVEPENGRFWHSIAEKRVTSPKGHVQLSGLLPGMSAQDLKGRRVKLLAGIKFLDNESGQRYAIARSGPVYFNVAR
jgi:hypothetical protein